MSRRAIHLPPSFSNSAVAPEFGEFLSCKAGTSPRRKCAQQRFGPDGIADYAPAYGRRGAITDDTQMTLFTAEGLLRGFVRESLKGICSVPSVISHAYRRWLLTQGVPAAGDLEVGTDGWLWDVRDLHDRRAPGNTCISALARMRHFTSERAPNNSKGAGAIMRIAPVGLVIGRSDEHAAPRAFELAKQISWVTHGHPSGYLSAACFAVMIHALLLGQTLEEGIGRGRRLLEQEPDSAETIDAIDQALSLVRAGAPPDEAMPSIGGAWVGEEALGIAIYCASVAPNFESAVRMAVNHEGDSDTTGALVGQLLGHCMARTSSPSAGFGT